MTDRFRHAMRLMRRHDPQSQEDGFALLRTHAGEHLDQLIAEFHQEHDQGLRCWLLELIGAARDERALPLLAEQLHSPDESLRSWAASGLRRLNNRQARRLLYEAGLYETKPQLD
ncbi:HEAT repeat domain-containing protein [Planosporangium sp. 12N6]|uniref:HEAT repeat domain-containing protein n=1 Tax=Planosporangium spinosum TaxID=3402278 RepID=UPI003CF6DD00